MEQNRFFPEMRGNFGFDCMRLPMNDEEVDKTEFCRTVDVFIAAGSNYFDTAHGYIKGKSETAIAACVSSRCPRERFLLTNKLTEPHFEKQEDTRPFFTQQPILCKTDYSNFYLTHAQNKKNYQEFKRCRAYETIKGLKQEGRVRHLSLLFHDKTEVLDMILDEYPEVEFVQIRLNYLDYESDETEGRKAHKVCEKRQGPVMVVEPVKGGSLVKLSEEVDRILRDLNGGSNASYAIRFAASFPRIMMVLSDMSNLEQMEDNLAVMCDSKPLTETGTEALHRIYAVFDRPDLILCVACRYHAEGSACPKNIRIPKVLGASNAYESFHNPNTINDYRNFMTAGDHGKAADCIRCGKCEEICPQHLEIRELLAKVAAIFGRQ